MPDPVLEFHEVLVSSHILDGCLHHLPVLGMDEMLLPVPAGMGQVGKEPASAKIAHLAPVRADAVDHVVACRHESSEALFGGAQLLKLEQAVDHRTQNGCIGPQKLDVVLVEVSRLRVIDLKKAVSLPAGPEDRHVDKGHHASLLHEGGNLEAVLAGNILADDRFAPPDGVGFRGMLVHGQAHVTHHFGGPAYARAHQEALAALLDFQHLGPPGAECLAHQAAGLMQHRVHILGLEGHVAEIGQHLALPEQHLDLVAVGHGKPRFHRS